MQRFFKTIQFLPEDRNNEVLVGNCIHILHGVCKRHNINNIGISFPDWCHETVGERITFISTNQQNLEYLLNQEYFFRMLQLKYFSISDTKLVTSAPNQEAIFIRNQAIDNGSPSAVRRDIKRAKKRALESGIQYIEPYASSQKTFEHYHRIPIASQSTKTDFKINIQQLKVSQKVEGDFGNYGLSNKSDKQCSVPMI